MNEVIGQILFNQRTLIKCELLKLVGRIDTEANKTREDLLNCVKATEMLLLMEGK